MGVTAARRVAFEILRRVERGGFAADLLHEEGARLSESDRRLATELVMGTLRYRAQLDYLILHFSGRPVARLDAEVADALRLGIYQLRYLTRIPAHAAVSESVQLTRHARRASAAGFVNAVLRKVNREPVDWPSRDVELSLPSWLLAQWERAFGAARAHRMARAFLQPPETYIHVPRGREQEAQGLGVEATPVAGCFRLTGERAGAFRIQDIGSQVVGWLPGAQAGMRVLDVCAAPGNKTAQLLETGARVIACDVSLARLKAVAGLGCGVVVADVAKDRLPFGCRFDRILVDAPCSGTGTLGRNPEIKWRLTPEEFVRHQERQVAIVRHAAAALAADGRLIYSTCSLEVAENEEVVARVEELLGLRVIEQLRRWPGEQPGDGFFAAVLAWKSSA
jgi:16S rRNA (cytosine967-C5)-methyltransferase